MKTFLLLALLPLLLPACHSRYVRFDAVGQDGRLGRNAHFAIQNEEEGHLASITVTAIGHRRDKFEDRRSDTVSFIFNVDNPGRDPVDLSLEECKVIDDQGRSLALLPILGPAPEGDATLNEITFDTGAADRLRSTGAVTLEWMYRYRSKLFRHKTRFLPVRYVVQYADPYWYPTWHFGFYYGGYYGRHHHH